MSYKNYKMHTKRLKLKKKWKVVLGLFSVLLIMATFSILTRPTLTLEEQPTCDLQEHLHTETCFVVEQDQQILNCNLQEHMHSEMCFPKIGETISNEIAVPSGSPEVETTLPNETVDPSVSPDSQTTLPNETIVPTVSPEVETTPNVNPNQALDQPLEPSANPTVEPVVSPNVETQQPSSSDLPLGTDKTLENTDLSMSNNTDVQPDNSVDTNVPSVTPGENVQPLILTQEDIIGSHISYKNPGEVNWTEINNSAQIQGNASLKLHIHYKNISLKSLVNHNYQMQYTLPSILRNPKTEGSILIDNKVVGTIKTEENTIIISFDEAWVEAVRKDGKDDLIGTFYVESAINLSEIPQDGKVDLQIGDVNVHLDFGNDVIAQFGSVSIEKKILNGGKVIDINGDFYIEYQLKVVAGADGSHQVKVVDYFTQPQLIESYVGLKPFKIQLSPTNENGPFETIEQQKKHGFIYLSNCSNNGNTIPEPNQQIQGLGCLVWDIGDMGVNETRFLTYRVKVANSTNYNGLTVQNSADVYSQQYIRNSSTANFEFKASMGGDKKVTTFPVSNVQYEKKGDKYIFKYQVNFDQASISTYPMKGVVLRDSLESPEQYVSYVLGEDNNIDFVLYRRNNPNDQTDRTEVNKSEYSLTLADNKRSFELTIGDMNPGDMYTFEYKVEMDIRAFSLGNPQQVTIKNSVIATSTNTKMSGQEYLNRFIHDQIIKYDNWVAKSVSGPTESEQTFGPDNKPFVVPKGSYEYTINLNKLGDWDITNATLTDKLSNDKLEYVGDARIDAIDVNASTVVDTKWYDINGKTQFTLKLSDCGFSSNSYKYVITYYAKPVNLDSTSLVKVNNDFILSGDIKKGDITFVIGDQKVSTEVTISGSYSLNATKKGWYYQPNNSHDKWQNGELYWAINLTGTDILQGTSIKDHLPSIGNVHVIRPDSLVGIFTGNLPDGKSITSFKSFADASPYLTEVDKSSYDVTFGNFNNNKTNELIVTFNKSISLQNTTMYIIVKTEPQALPQEDRHCYEYNNDLFTSDNGLNWISRERTIQYIYGAENILKEPGPIITWNPNQTSNPIQHIGGPNGNVVTKLDDANALPSGVHASWTVKVNYGGKLSGSYRVIDTIPDGMEIMHARLKWRGDYYRNNIVDKPVLSQCLDLKSNGWDEHIITGTTDNNGDGEVKSYFYTKGNQICWQVDNLIANNIKDATAVDIQVLCRLTDQEVLQGGARKYFNNEVQLLRMDGSVVDTANNQVDIRTSSLSKKALNDSLTNNHGHIIPFEIRINELGQDLVKNSNTVVVVDEFSSTLKLDPMSIKVKNLITNQYLAANEYTASLDYVNQDKTEEKLRIELPDSLPLEITYSAIVQAKPGETVSLNNKAYWEGFSVTGGQTVEINNYSYNIGGTVVVSDRPKVEITKLDKDNVNKVLPGAEFKMVELELQNNKYVEVKGRDWVGVTNQDGKLVFGDNTPLMSFNKVYRIQETKAPDKYIKDDQPYYFIVAKKTETNEYPTFVDAIDGHKVDIYYPDSNAIYKIAITNVQAKIIVNKVFANINGDKIDLICGDYKFGLYDVANPSVNDKPLQIATLSIFEGQKREAKLSFTNVDPGKDYYIYELDNNNQPIKNGSIATVNNNKFKVNYSVNDNKANVGSEIIVTNQVMVLLPETGGSGNGIYYILGTSLLVVGSIVYLIRKRKCNN